MQRAQTAIFYKNMDSHRPPHPHCRHRNSARDKLTVVVMDNASIHHHIDQDILHQWMVRDRFVLLFLPPYSPELNLIEILWKQAKYHWREFVTWAAKDLRKEVQTLFDGFGTKFNFSYA